MSTDAPWIALSIDWQDSEMLDDAPFGVRLAWVCLLCFVKAQGRAGKVRFRDKVFAANYRLNGESVRAVVERSIAAGAVELHGDTLTVVNWKRYQDPKARSSSVPIHRKNKADPPKRRRFSKTRKNDATKHQAPSTKDRSPPQGQSSQNGLVSGSAIPTQKKIPKGRGIPPNPPSGLPILPDVLDCDQFRECLAKWLAYKAERKEQYKPTGLAAMVSRAATLASQHGILAVMDAMERAEANDWKGWDHDVGTSNSSASNLSEKNRRRRDTMSRLSRQNALEQAHGKIG
jgi:hypothetical protein